MNSWLIMEQAAIRFANRLQSVPDAVAKQVPLPCEIDPKIIWTNFLLTSPQFRHGHVETFVVPDRISILHVCLFPHLDDPAPIFGFDMIAGPARVTGIFLDLSPTADDGADPRFHDVCLALKTAAFAQRRSLPEWGHVFSEHVLAIRPTDLDEVSRAIALAEAALEIFLNRSPVSLPEHCAVITAGQARYIAAQRQNEHTFKMLAGFTGKAYARKFIDQVLFPDIP